MFMIPNRCRF